MGKFINLISKRFGKLTVVDISSKKDKYGQLFWNCICDCEERCTVRGTSLRNGHTMSCGCAVTGPDETGKVYGLLTVIDRAEKTHSSIHWNCECVCKNRIVVRADHLRSGKVASCGCGAIQERITRHIDEIGKMYGKLKVLCINERKGKDAGLYYDCECSCGQIRTVRGVRLRKRLVMSCGCGAIPIGFDEIGKQYGKWLVVGLSNKKGRRGEVYLQCKCECGQEKAVLGVSLRNRYSTSCGCSRNNRNSKHFRDLTGHRFGKLLVENRTFDKRDGKTRWNCRCECGNSIVARSDKLLGGFGLSCGCRATPNEIGQVYGKLTVERSYQMQNGEAHWPCKCSCGKVVWKRGVDLRNGHVRACSKGCLAKDRFFETGINELIRRTEQSASKRGLPYSLGRSDHERTCGQPCAYCNCLPSNELKTFRRRTLKFKYSGIDRIDPSKGYVHGNINPCCRDCNIAKGDKSLIDYFEWVKRAYFHMSLQYNVYRLD